MLNIQSYRDLLKTQRLTGHFIHRSYNLVEHQYGVAMLFQIFAIEEGIEYDLKALNVVLHHDVAERITSDLPYPIKNFSEQTKQAWRLIENEVCKGKDVEEFSDENIKKLLTEQQYKLFKAVDILELWIFIWEELHIGNKTAEMYKVKDVCEGLMIGKFKSIDKYLGKIMYE